MPHKRSRRRRPDEEQEQQKRNEETVRRVNAVLAERFVDTAALRKIAAVRGLVNSSLRQRVWPLLLGLPVHGHISCTTYQEQSCQGHRDSQVLPPFRAGAPRAEIGQGLQHCRSTSKQLAHL